MFTLISSKDGNLILPTDTSDQILIPEYEITIDENIDIGTEIAKIKFNVDDPSLESIAEYKFKVVNNLFLVVHPNGEINIAPETKIDFEKFIINSDSYSPTFTIDMIVFARVVDNITRSRSFPQAKIKVTINDKDEPLEFKQISVMKLPENSVECTVAAEFMLLDPDKNPNFINDNLIFEVSQPVDDNYEGDYAKFFTVKKHPSIIGKYVIEVNSNATVSDGLDFEKFGGLLDLTIKVKSTDDTDGILLAEKLISVTLTDIIEMITLVGPNEFIVDENTAPNTEVEVTTGNSEVNSYSVTNLSDQTVTYNLIGFFKNWFIVDDTGERAVLKVASRAIINYEDVKAEDFFPEQPKGLIKLKLIATITDSDGVKNNKEKLIEILIEDVEEPITLIVTPLFEFLFEHSSEIKIGTITSNDPEGESVNNTIINTKYSIEDNKTNHLEVFEIRNKNEIWIKNSQLLDFEEFAKTITLRVEAFIDFQDIPGVVKEFVINLKDISDIITIYEGSLGKLTDLILDTSVDTYIITNSQQFEIKKILSNEIHTFELWLKEGQTLDLELETTSEFTLDVTPRKNNVNLDTIHFKLNVNDVSVRLDNVAYIGEENPSDNNVYLHHVKKGVISFAPSFYKKLNDINEHIILDDSFILTYKLFDYNELKYKQYYNIDPEKGIISLKDGHSLLEDAVHKLVVKALINGQVEGEKLLEFNVINLIIQSDYLVNTTINKPIEISADSFHIHGNNISDYNFIDSNKQHLSDNGSYKFQDGNLLWTPKDDFVGEDDFYVELIPSNSGENIVFKVNITVGTSFDINNGIPFTVIEDILQSDITGNFLISESIYSDTNYVVTVNNNIINFPNASAEGDYGVLYFNPNNQWSYKIDWSEVENLNGIDDDDGHSYTETFKVLFSVNDDLDTPEIETKRIFSTITIELFGKSNFNVDFNYFTQNIDKRDSIDHLSLKGNNNSNVFYSGSGDDVLNGGKGHDRLNGGSGDDVLNGENGKDVLNGGMGKDELIGGNGRDILNGGLGKDILTGGGGHDKFVLLDSGKLIETDVIADFSEGDLLLFSTDIDEIWVEINSELNGLLIYEDKDGSDSIVLLKGWNTWLSSSHLVDSDIDIKLYVENISPLNSGTPVFVLLNGDHGDEHLNGDHGFDMINGLGGDDTLFGRYGNDILNGGVGNDTLYGGTGNDVLYGEAGVDTLIGGAGEDILNGGDGKDILSYFSSTDGVYVYLKTNTASGGHAEGDLISNFEDLTGSEHNDVLGGDDGANSITGGAGNDIITGNGGADTLVGGAGIDRFVFKRLDIGIKDEIARIVDFDVDEDLIDLTRVPGKIYISAEGTDTILTTGNGINQYVALIENVILDELSIGDYYKSFDYDVPIDLDIA